MSNNSGYRIILKEAYKAFRQKRYSEAIVLLEKIILHNRIKEPYPYFLLCVSYLLCNKFSDADIMIKKVRDADPDYLPLKQLEIFLLLKSASNVHEVLAACIEKLERYPEDKYLKKALLYLRKPKNFTSFQKKAKLTDFVYIPKPKPAGITDAYQSIPDKPVRHEKYKQQKAVRKNNFSKVFLIIILVFLFAALSGTAYYYYTNKLRTDTANNKSLPIDTVSIDILQYELIDKILKTKPPVFYYSNDEIINDFNKAKILIKNEKYNEAIIIINKIANSNANYRVKERNEFLQKFISGIEYKNYNPIPIEKVLQKPYLYKGSFVKWKGKIANLKSKDNKLQFNLLIDYKNDYKFSGVIDVYSANEYKNIINGDIVTLEGVFVNTVGNDNRIYLVADKIIK